MHSRVPAVRSAARAVRKIFHVGAVEHSLPEWPPCRVLFCCPPLPCERIARFRSTQPLVVFFPAIPVAVAFSSKALRIATLDVPTIATVGTRDDHHDDDDDDYDEDASRRGWHQRSVARTAASLGGGSYCCRDATYDVQQQHAFFAHIDYLSQACRSMCALQ